MGLGEVTKEKVSNWTNLLKQIHPLIILRSGGIGGIRDEGGLYNSVYRVLTFLQKHPGHSYLIAAYIYKEFATRHHFMDGNKRTAHLFVRIFLISRNLQLKVQYKEPAQFIISIAHEKKSLKEIEAWVRRHTHPFPNKAKLHHFSNMMNDFTAKEE